MKKYIIYLILVFLVITTNQTLMVAQLKFAGVSVSGVYTFNNIGNNGFPNFPIENISFTPDNSINYDINLFATYRFYKGFFGGLEFGYYQSELVYLGVEHTTVIKNKRPVDAAIRHSISAYFKWLYPSVLVGYTYKTLSLCTGTRFNFNTSSNFYHTQTIIEPDSMFFINPDMSLNADIDKVNSLVYMPFIRFTYDFGKDLFTASTFDAQLDFEYSMSVNNFVDEYSISTSNIKFGINIGFDLSDKPKDLAVIRDTVFQRDTIVSYSYNVNTATVKMLSSMISSGKTREKDIIHYITTITQHYSRKLPRPKSMLNGELRTVFIGEDGGEMQECVISYSQVKETRRIPKYQNNKLTYTTESEMKEIIQIPNIRFYTSFIAEAGLDSMIINLFDGNKLIKKIVSTNENENYIDIGIDTIVDIETSKYLRYELILVDLDDQKKKVADGKIVFKNKKNNIVLTKDIYYLDLNLEYEKITHIFNSIISRAKKKHPVIYYYMQVAPSEIKKIEKLKYIYSDIKFIKKDRNNLLDKYQYDRKNKDYLYIVIEK